MISRIFIDRPIFAWVIAIFIMLGGLGAVYTLPIEQYPDIAPLRSTSAQTIRARLPKRSNPASRR